MWLGVLGGAFGAYELSDAFRAWFPVKAGGIPLATIWFGALGGLTLSLSALSNEPEGVAERVERVGWHLWRPVAGAIMGPMGCLILIVTAEAASNKPVVANDPVFYVVAFVLGFREEAFRQLIKRAGDALIAPSGKDT